MAFGLSAGAVAMIGSVAAPVIGGLMADDNGAEGMNDASAEASRLQSQIGKEQWDRYKSVYGPVEDEFVNESKGLGSIANQNKGAQQAAADVAGSFANAREKLVTVPGANPSSQSYLQEQNRINLAEAAASAAAQSGARVKVQDRGRAAMTDVVSLGKNLPANASSAIGSSAYGMAAAGNYAQARSDRTAAGIGQTIGNIADKFAKGLPSSTPDGGYGSVPGGYQAPGESVIYNNPSAYVAPYQG